jgi:hypothetical protein
VANASPQPARLESTLADRATDQRHPLGIPSRILPAGVALANALGRCGALGFEARNSAKRNKEKSSKVVAPVKVSSAVFKYNVFLTLWM